MKHKKVLHILREIKFSGAEVMLKVASPVFRSSCLNLHALSTGEQVGSYASILESASYQLHYIPYRRSFSFRQLYRHYQSYYQLLRKEKFDIVHSHGELNFFWYVLIARITGVERIIHSVHNVFFYLNLPVRIKRGLYRFIANRFLNVRFLAVGTSVAEVERKFFLNTTEVAFNWIDNDVFIPATHHLEKLELRRKWNIPPNAKVLISVGASTSVKNQKDILLATCKLREKLNNIYYLHVGDGPLQSALKLYATELGIQDCVRFLGQLEAVREVLVASDIFVMTSQYEGLGNSLLEALSCGIPAVVYKVYGLKDLIQDGSNGFAIESDPDILTEKLLILATREALRVQMGQEAHRKIIRHFNKDSLIANWLKAYH